MKNKVKVRDKRFLNKEKIGYILYSIDEFSVSVKFPDEQLPQIIPLTSLEII